MQEWLSVIPKNTQNWRKLECNLEKKGSKNGPKEGWCFMTYEKSLMVEGFCNAICTRCLLITYIALAHVLAKTIFYIKLSVT